MWHWRKRSEPGKWVLPFSMELDLCKMGTLFSFKDDTLLWTAAIGSRTLEALLSSCAAIQLQCRSASRVHNSTLSTVQTPLANYNGRDKIIKFEPAEWDKVATLNGNRVEWGGGNKSEVGRWKRRRNGDCSNSFKHRARHKNSSSGYLCMMMWKNAGSKRGRGGRGKGRKEEKTGVTVEGAAGLMMNNDNHQVQEKEDASWRVRYHYEAT